MPVWCFLSLFLFLLNDCWKLSVQMREFND